MNGGNRQPSSRRSPPSASRTRSASASSSTTGQRCTRSLPTWPSPAQSPWTARPKRSDGAWLEAVLNVPPRGIGPNSLKQLRAESPRLTWAHFFAGMVRSDVRSQVQESCRDLFELLVGFSREVETTPPAQMIERVVDESGYRAWLDEDFAADRRMYAVEALQKDAAAYTSVEAFLAAVKQNMRSPTDGTASDRGVALSSIHGAKGLEWPLVIVIGLYEGSLPHAKDRAGSPSDDPSGERRLAYVAFSRAAEHLHLTAPRHIEAGGSLVAVSPSRYLQELVKEGQLKTMSNRKRQLTSVEKGGRLDK